MAGSASYSGGIFTVRGSGAGITGASDQFFYVFESLGGDGELRARILLPVQNTSPNARAGVMIRESLAPNSAYAMMAFVRRRPRPPSAPPFDGRRHRDKRDQPLHTGTGCASFAPAPSSRPIGSTNGSVLTARLSIPSRWAPVCTSDSRSRTSTTPP